MQPALVEVPRICDSIGACVAIPVFNHGKTVGDVVRRSLAQASTVLVCDDGSTDGSGEQAKQAGAELLTLPKNQGKGSALVALFDEAVRRGFRYVICLDADGQHLPEDLPRFVEAVRAEPGALVVGSRDLVAAGAPGRSQFGRKFSNFWVWFEAGNRVQDSQCGFRAYPLPESRRLAGWLRRYDFEVEILLRAGWSGVPVRSTPIEVLYPKDRVTHFRPLADNVRISLLNAVTCLWMMLPLPLGPLLREAPSRPGLSLLAIRRWAWLGCPGPFSRVTAAALGVAPGLTGAGPSLWAVSLLASAAAGLGMVPAVASMLAFVALAGRGVANLPAALGVGTAALAFGVAEALWRRRALSRAARDSPAPPRTWTGKSVGGVFGHWFFFQLTRLGTWPAYAFLYPVVLFYTFTARAGREASLQYQERLFGPARGPLQRFARAYRHILHFARTLVDKALLATRGAKVFRCTHEGLEHLKAAADSKKGAVLITAHIGNWDVAGGLLEGKLEAPLTLVAIKAEEERLAQYLEAASGPRPKIIAVNDSDLSSLTILHALRDGELVAIQGDRPMDNRVARVPFLGADAPFPVGPFIVAAVSGAPLISTFNVQVGRVSYRFIADPPRHFAFDRSRDRNEQMREWVEGYARRLEALVREYPYQWFNFFDFWNAEPPPRPKGGPRPAPPGA
ncbi:MAG: glycosyltransferase family 2 protein [Myxococcaceae bacterium]